MLGRVSPVTGIVLAVGFLAGCISPLDELESAVEVERSLLANWLPGGVEVPLSGGPVQAAADAQPAPSRDITADSSLDECLRYAVRRSPDLEAAHDRWRAALERVPQVRTLPDPRVGYAYFIDEVETRVGPQRHRVSVAQTFPWFGTLDLRGDVAGAVARVAFERFEATARALFRRVKEAYLELHYLRGAVEITRDTARLLEQLEEIARTRYAVAESSYLDVIRIQIELEKVGDRLRELEDFRRPAAARLNAALDRPADAEAPWPDSIPEQDAPLDAARLTEVLKASNPLLAAIDHEIAQHRLAARLARKDGFPDVTFSLDYIVTSEASNRSLSESGDDPIIAGVSMNVPLWQGKYEAGVREALRRRLAAAARRKAEENRLVVELEQALFAYRDGRRRVALYRDSLLPKARDALDTSMRGYQTATYSFLDLLDAERVLLELRLSERRARVDAAIAWAHIEMVVGDGITAAADAPSPEETSP